MTKEPSVEPMNDSRAASARRSWPRRLVVGGVAAIAIYVSIAYLVLPLVWKRYASRHPSFDDVPGITQTADDIPGDPLNVALIGGQADLEKIMAAAQWRPAAPLSLRSDLKIAEDTVLKRADDDAPVSSLYLFGRKEDFAFERPVDDNPRQRHHVRFWRADKQSADGRLVWIGSAVYDDRVGISRRTGQITHHTSPDVDAERDKLFHDLEGTGDLAETFHVPGFHRARSGKNGGGDPWHTDGDLYAGIIKPGL